jgi:putative two-component system response regulator
MNAPAESPSKATILVVDDTPENLSLMSNLLRSEYRVKVANSGEKALRIAAADVPPDLILLDVMMPEMDGHEVCRRLMADERTRHTPVIFLTAKSAPEDEKEGFELGAVDYITKPISPPTVMARVRTHLTLKGTAEFLRDKNAFLEQEVARRTRELQGIQEVTVHALASLAETRDNDTGNHICRTQHYVHALARKLRSHQRFADYLTDDMIATLFKSAPLHDIGKVGIPDSILLKPGRLEPAEFEIMKAHSALGRDAIQRAEDRLGIPVGFLACAKEIAYGHHEKWDGSGYPQGLAEEAIPISARLMAVADVYDALISRRVYKAAMSSAEAVEIIAAGRASQFDPDVVGAFLEIAEDLHRIADCYRDDLIH